MLYDNPSSSSVQSEKEKSPLKETSTDFSGVLVVVTNQEIQLNFVFLKS